MILFIAKCHNCDFYVTTHNYDLVVDEFREHQKIHGQAAHINKVKAWKFHLKRILKLAAYPVTIIVSVLIALAIVDNPALLTWQCNKLDDSSMLLTLNNTYFGSAKNIYVSIHSQGPIEITGNVTFLPRNSVFVEPRGNGTFYIPFLYEPDFIQFRVPINKTLDTADCTNYLYMVGGSEDAAVHHKDQIPQSVQNRRDIVKPFGDTLRWAIGDT